MLFLLQNFIIFDIIRIFSFVGSSFLSCPKSYFVMIHPILFGFMIVAINLLVTSGCVLQSHMCYNALFENQKPKYKMLFKTFALQVMLRLLLNLPHSLLSWVQISV